MLDVDGGINIDARPQQLLHILVALDMPAALGVGMGQLVHQNQLGMPRQRRVQVKFLLFRPFTQDRHCRQLLQSLQQRLGLWPGVGLDIPRHHVHAGGLRAPRRLQHGVSFANTGGVTEKDLQLASRHFFRLP